MTRQEFKNVISAIAVRQCANTGIFPSVVVAQALIEGAWGQDYKAAIGNNPFGHRWTPSWGGAYIQKVPGRGAKWRRYPSLEEAVKAHIKVLQKFKTYGVALAKTPIAQVRAIEKAPYNTGPDRHRYAENLTAAIKGQNLQILDGQMMAMEKTINENGLAFSQQDGITRALHNLFG